MIKSILTSIIIFTLVILSCSTARADKITGIVTGVSDGDTITITRTISDTKKETYKIRLLSIDAPELKQPYGKRSKGFLSALVFNKQVTVTWTKRDRYKRILGTVSINGKNINEEMIKAGYAWHYRQYSKDKTLQAMEDKARADKKGLWQDSNPVAPWDYRRKK